MRISLDGRRAVVTGAAQGLGQAMARALAGAGVEVAALDIDESRLDALKPDGIATAVVDATDAAALAEAVKTHGPFDIAVHVAGGLRGQAGRPLEEITTAEWDAIVSINQTAAYFLAQAVAPHKKAAGHGRIITISSRAGLDISLTGIQAYASAKAGQIGLVRQLGHELGQFGITVNSVAPGFVRSNPTTEIQWDALGADGQEKLLHGIAMRRLGTPQDIADAVVFLASDNASWITGQTLSVDGGR